MSFYCTRIYQIVNNSRRELPGIRINFIEYKFISLKFLIFLEWREKTVYNEPKNDVNLLLNMDRKGSSKLYRELKASNDHVIYNICESWRSKLYIETAVSQTFSLHHLNILTLNQSISNLELFKTGLIH